MAEGNSIPYQLWKDHLYLQITKEERYKFFLWTKIAWDIWVLKFESCKIPQTARRLNPRDFQEFWSHRESIDSRNKGLKSIR